MLRLRLGFKVGLAVAGVAIGYAAAKAAKQELGKLFVELSEGIGVIDFDEPEGVAGWQDLGYVDLDSFDGKPFGIPYADGGKVYQDQYAIARATLAQQLFLEMENDRRRKMAQRLETERSRYQYGS